MPRHVISQNHDLNQAAHPHIEKSMVFIIKVSKLDVKFCTLCNSGTSLTLPSKYIYYCSRVETLPQLGVQRNIGQSYLFTALHQHWETTVPWLGVQRNIELPYFNTTGMLLCAAGHQHWPSFLTKYCCFNFSFGAKKRKANIFFSSVRLFLKGVGMVLNLFYF